MKRILIIDDDEAVRRLCRVCLEDEFDIVDTGDPERAVLMVLQHQPDAILLDLAMPQLSGFEMCRTFASMSFTHHVPIIVISGEDPRNKAYCESLGAAGFFEKPIDFDRLRKALTGQFPSKKTEQRAQPRVQFKALLKLRGNDGLGQHIEIRATTENISAGGFLASCDRLAEKHLVFDVYFCRSDEHFLGRARAVRTETLDLSHPVVAFQFVETANWGASNSSQQTPLLNAV